tara:strand:+ start:147 stop:2111 length:1965 start_codon:yes stop_codon:yes gene_type:complete
MSPQHDYVIDNSTGANVRSDINNALLAISSNNSGSSAPSTTYALQTFANTTDTMLQLRNAANNAFVNLRKFDGSCPLPDGTNSAPSLFFDDDTNTGLYSSAADTLNFTTGGTERLELAAGGTVFNEDGADVDFRIESDSDAFAFYVDAGNDRIGFGTGSPSGFLHAVTSQTTVAMLESTDAGATGVNLVFRHTTASPADSDNVGTISFQAQSDGGANHTYGTIVTTATDVSDGSEDANITMSTSTAGTTTQKLRLNNEGIALSNLGSGGGIAIDHASGGASSNFSQIGMNAHRTGEFDVLGQFVQSWNSDSVATIRFAAGDDTSNKDNGKIGFLTQPDSSSGEIFRMLIDEDGGVGIGATDIPTGFKCTINGDLTIGEASGSDNSFIDQKQNGQLEIINSGRSDNTGGVRVNRMNNIAGDTTYFRDVNIYDGKGTSVVYVDGSAGSVGIGTSSPNSLLEVNTGTSSGGVRIVSDEVGLFMVTSNTGDSLGRTMVLNSTRMDSGSLPTLRLAGQGGIDLAVDSSTTRMRIDTSGNIGAPSGTNIFNASDSRVKKNVENLDKGLAQINLLRPVSFNWVDGFCDTEKDKLYGFIAQEVQSLDSNLIQDFSSEIILNKDTENETKITDVLRVNEKFIIPMLVKAVQELSAKVAALEAA